MYKIAVASSDGVNVDLNFGSANRLLIYEVNGDGFKRIEERAAPGAENPVLESGTGEGCAEKNGCGEGSGCGSGAGCGGNPGLHPNIELISDCRCIVCKKVGFRLLKELERRAIASFDIECEVGEALEKITAYFYKVDNHISLRGTS